MSTPTYCSRRYAMLKDRGRCVTCATRKTEKGSARCKDCKESHRMLQRSYRECSAAELSRAELIQDSAIG